jgi:hypothetical protein
MPTESESREKHRPVTQAVGPDLSTDDADGGARFPAFGGRFSVGLR